ncbi:chloride channel protein [Demequina sp. NBRC 110057]|uniref:chloride channel protein n=1 Tax=Demequina sp. NBRC 110057 TaxID=1570346 RepID=UPI00190E9801|nr:chloride channel protein [Demequina sp. NBRC 110057]
MTPPRRLLQWRPTLLIAGSERATMLALAVVAGIMAGFGAVAFRWLVEHATLLFSGQDDYAGTTDHPAHPWLPGLGGWFVVLVPVVGGLIYGPLVHRFAREARGHGVPEVMYAIQRKGGRIAGRVAFVKAIASAVTIGSGGSVGREGPIVQIGSALSSSLGRVTRIPGSQLPLLVACGAAGGIAATFNAPIAGVFFALELLLGSFAVGSFAAVVLASVTASVIARAILGNEAFLVLPELSVHHLAEYGLFVALGLLAGCVGIGFSKVLYWFEDMADKVWRGPEWLRPAAGGLLLGLLLLVLPQMYGVGYPVLENAVVGDYLVPFLLLLLVAKVIATSLTIAIGGSGGVFAPSLFLGAMLGAAAGQAIDAVAPGLGVSPGAYAVVGMAAVFAGSSRAPITAVLILFELTGEYSIILPLMLAVVVATATSSVLSRDTIYTEKLRRRGIDLTRHTSRTAGLAHVQVRELMAAAPPTLATGVLATTATRLILDAGRPSLPVVSDDGHYVGVVSASAAARALADDDDADDLVVADVSQWREHIGPDDTIDSVLDTMLDGSAPDGLPVLDDDGRVVGWLRHEVVLRAVATGAAT